MSEPINVLLPELVVRPRGSYITYTGKETNRPSVADFIKSKAQEARVNMSLTVALFNVLNWKQKPRRVWDAITGKYYVLGVGTVSSASLLND